MSEHVANERVCLECSAVIRRPQARYCEDCRWRHRGRHKKYTWTPEMDALLRRRYDSHVKGRAQEIADELGWPKWVVKKRAAYLGLARRTTESRKDWTADEEAFLLEHAGRRHVNWMAKRLGRTLTSVVVKLKRLQISRRHREGYTLRELELCFGVDHRVIEAWERKGMLKVKRQGTARVGKQGDPWCVTDEQLLLFIRNHPMEFRLDRVDQFWFMDLMLGGDLVRMALEASREPEEVSDAA